MTEERQPRAFIEVEGGRFVPMNRATVKDFRESIAILRRREADLLAELEDVREDIEHQEGQMLAEN